MYHDGSGDTSLLKISEQFVQFTYNPDSETISGITDIKIQILQPEFFPRVLFLMARQMNILSCHINDEAVKFKHYDTHKALEVKNTDEVIIRDSKTFLNIYKEVSNSPDLVIDLDTVNEIEFMVRITFEHKRDSTTVLTNTNMIYTNPNPDGAASLFPCIDSISNLIGYTYEIIFPKNYSAIGSGQLTQKQVTADHKISLKYSFSTVCQANAIGFVIGKFKEFNSFAPVMIYCNDDDDVFFQTMEISADFVSKASKLFYGEDSEKSLIVSFIYINTLQEIVYFPNLVYFSHKYFVQEDNIHSFVTSITKICESIVAQYIKYYYPIKRKGIYWVQDALIKYFTDIVLQKKYGVQFVYNIRWDNITDIIRYDIFKSLTLNCIDPMTDMPYNDEFLKTKGKLLMYYLESHVHYKGENSKLLSIFQPNLIKQDFFEAIKNITKNFEYEEFFKQYVDGFGISLISFCYDTKTRNHQVNFYVKQRNSAGGDVFPCNLSIMFVAIDLQKNVNIKISDEMKKQIIVYEKAKGKTRATDFSFENGEMVRELVKENVFYITIDPVHSLLQRSEIDSSGDVTNRKETDYLSSVYSSLHINRDVYSQREVLSYIRIKDPPFETVFRLAEVLNDKRYFYAVRGHAARVIGLFESETKKPYLFLLLYYIKNVGGNSRDENYREVDKIDLPVYSNKAMDPVEIDSDVEAKYSEMDSILTNFLRSERLQLRHNFSDLSENMVRINVIKAASLVRVGGYTPLLIIVFFERLRQNSTSSTSLSQDFLYELFLGLGRLKYENINDNIKLFNEIKHYFEKENKLSDFKVLRACVIALISQTIKLIHYKAFSKEISDLKEDVIIKLRTKLNQADLFDQNLKIDIYKSLLYLIMHCSYIQESQNISFDIVTFQELLSDVKHMIKMGEFNSAAECLRETYKIKYYGVLYENGDPEESFLFSLPPKTSKEKGFAYIFCTSDELIVAENIWLMFTYDAKYHNCLRSEGFRLYTALYNSQRPEVYRNKAAKAKNKFNIKPSRHEMFGIGLKKLQPTII